MVRNRFGRRSESTYSRRRLLQASGAGLVGVTGLSTLGSADDDSEIPWNRFHSILADRYNEQEADVAVEITEPFAETGVPGLTPPEHEAVMERLYLDDRTPELTADIEEFREDPVNAAQRARPQPGDAISVIGDILSDTCPDRPEDWDDADATGFSIAAAVARGEADDDGYMRAWAEIVLAGYARVEAYNWSVFVEEEGGEYSVSIPFEASLEIAEGSWAELEIVVTPRDDDVAQGSQVIMPEERWEGPRNHTIEDTANDVVTLLPGVEYDVEAHLVAEFHGTALCLTETDDITTSEFDLTESCEQEVEIDLDEIELVGCT